MLFCASGWAQECSVSGIIRDSATKERVPAAIVRVAGTSQGTVCNAEGTYRLNLHAGTYTVIGSCLGYRPDSIRVSLTGDMQQNFTLTPAAILMPEVVVTSEDPAYGIIRQAIASKKKWLEKLHTYTMDAFTRQVIRRDTSIASITESFTRGYWEAGDTLREVVKQRRQTENIKESENFAAVGRLLNFCDDDIRFIGYSFVGPIAGNAFDYYTYKLIRTRQSGSYDIYEIQLTPRSDVVPCFSGTVMIAGGTYALVGVDVEPNRAFSIPFVKDKYLRYRQQFSLYEQTFWLPADIRIDARFSLSVIGFSIPPIGFSQTSVMTNYEINVPLPDSLFHKPRLVVDSSATRYDSTLWASPSLLPLTTEEQTAYKTLDSTKTLDVQFRPGGVAMTLGIASGSSISALNFADISFNRVEGVHLGASHSFDDLSRWFVPRGGFAYGFSDKKSKYSAGGTFYPAGSPVIGLRMDFYRLVSTFPENGYYGREFNSLTALFGKNDYSDYYLAKGWSAVVSSSLGENLKADVGFIHELQSSLPVVTQYSFLYRGRDYRANPEVTEGRLRAVHADVNLGEEPTPLDIVTRNGLDMSVEYSSPRFAGSQFDFVRYNADASLTFPTFGRRFLFPPTMRVHLAAGTSTGTLPPQRVFSLESQSSNYAAFGVMRAMSEKEYGGTGYLALNVEHNFRNLPFLALGLSFLAERDIELIVHGGVARNWNDGDLPLNTTQGLYSEAGFGISRIFDLFRCDFTWRLSAPGNFRFCVSVANLF